MDEMSSVEFRKRYAKLLQPTRVTVNGHPIGMWLPWFENPTNWDKMRADAQGVADRARAIANEPNPYRRPFTPAPKPGKR